MNAPAPTTSEKIKDAITTWTNEEAKFAKGNKAAGTRARLALQEVRELAKQRRAEISAEKNAE